MAVRLSFEIYGDTVLDRTLEGIQGRARDAEPAFHELAESFVEVQRQQFRTEGGYGSGGWAPLAPSYAAWKERHYPGQPILQRTGDLYRSLVGENSLHVRVVESHFLLIGSGVDYGAFHMRPGPHGRPARKPVELPESVRRSWVRTLQRFLVEGDRGTPEVLR